MRLLNEDKDHYLSLERLNPFILENPRKQKLRKGVILVKRIDTNILLLLDHVFGNDLPEPFFSDIR